MSEAPVVGIIMGSRTDWETMRHAADTLEQLGVPFEKEVVSAHRTPDKLFEYAASAEARGLQVVIAGAGGAAHLPGMTASKTLLPVLGVPVETKALRPRLAPLIARMPAGCQSALAVGRGRSSGAPGSSDRRPLGRGCARAARRVPGEPDGSRARRARSVRVTALVGCIGGGQLGRMLALAGAPLDVRLRFLDPAADACAGAVGELVVGAYDDPPSLERLADGADVVTYEFENVPVQAARSVDAVPNARALELVRTASSEGAVQAAGIPTAAFGRSGTLVSPRLWSRADSDTTAGPACRRDDGGARRQDELAEAIVPFDRELSRSSRRVERQLDRVLPAHRERAPRGILAVSRAPARDAPQAAAERLAAKLLDDLDYVGVLAVELFDVGGEVLANEFAPRVHNTGHWTIDGVETSQFENHLRAILGLPLGSTTALGDAVMVNLVGVVPPLERLLAVPEAHVHLYGKEPRPGRKLGHVTLVDADEAAVAEVVALASAAWLS